MDRDLEIYRCKREIEEKENQINRISLTSNEVEKMNSVRKCLMELNVVDDINTESLKESLIEESSYILINYTNQLDSIKTTYYREIEIKQDELRGLYD